MRHVQRGGALATATRLVPPQVILLALVVQIGLSVVVNQVLFPLRVFRPLALGTQGLVSTTLSANLLMLAVNVLGVIMLVGGLRARDLGLRPGWRAVTVAVGVALATWLGAQGAIALAAALAGQPIGFSDQWIMSAALWTSGRLIGQVFGNALYEETFFRGFLLVQGTWWSARARSPEGDLAAPSARTWLLAVLLTQGIFAISHVPNRLMGGAYTSIGSVLVDQGLLLAAGIVFAVIYLGTRNLWLCVLLHAFSNRPTPLLTGVANDDGTNAVALAVVLAFAVSMALLVRRSRRRALQDDG